LQLQYQKFCHPIYKQFRSEPFTAGLSVIDAAMNVGWKNIFNHEEPDA
jgi:fructose 1,6-bisphosphatase